MQHAPGFLVLCDDARTRVREVTIDDVIARLALGEAFELVDVREDLEWAAGHAQGARHLGRGILERDVEGKIPARNTEIILYCGGGYRSLLAADSLKRMGYTNVASLIGGYKAWQSAGAPIDKD